MRAAPCAGPSAAPHCRPNCRTARPLAPSGPRTPPRTRRAAAARRDRTPHAHWPRSRLADYESVVKLADSFNAADLRNVCTEAGMFAIRAERDYCIHEDFMKAVRKVAENKKLEGKLEYSKV